LAARHEIAQEHTDAFDPAPTNGSVRGSPSSPGGLSRFGGWGWQNDHHAAAGEGEALQQRQRVKTRPKFRQAMCADVHRGTISNIEIADNRTLARQICALHLPLVASGSVESQVPLKAGA
jgi:hypothetical protein